jgi:hypothetical protein
MKVSVTMGQLCTERSLESKNWSAFSDFTEGAEASSSKSFFSSLATIQYIIDP